MRFERFLIAPLNDGLKTNVKAWLIPDDAYARLENAYVWRGRLRKRFGSRVMNIALPQATKQLGTRLRYNTAEYRIALGVTDSSGDASGTVPGGLYQVGQRFFITNGTTQETDEVTSSTPGAQPMTSTGPSTTHTYDISTGAYVFVGGPTDAQIYFYPNTTGTDSNGDVTGFLPDAPVPLGTMISIGSVMFTVVSLGTPATLLVANGSATTATLNTTTGEYVFVGVLNNNSVAVGNTPVWYYPSLPVMGLLSKDTSSISSEFIIGFDTKYSYTYENGGWVQLGNETWSGADNDFFSGVNYRGITADEIYFFVVNNNPTDGIRYLDTANANWTSFSPPYNSGGDEVLTAKIIVSFKNRLLLLNVVEEVSGSPIRYGNRCRFSAVGNPLAADAWLQPAGTYGKGGWVDIPTKQDIITAQIIKDRLIVYCEFSTYELVYTGNQNLPFVWQQINNELGSQSSFSVIPFDKQILAIGTTGVHSCNGANVERIDEDIPNTVFQIQAANDGLNRVYGIRDYYGELAYWTMPYIAARTYPNKVLVYNYKAGSWSLNDDSITCFGYYNIPDTFMWEDMVETTWDDAEFAWNSAALNARFQTIIAGNQQGWVFVLGRDIPENAPALSITNVVQSGSNLTITCYDHNLASGDYIRIASVFSENSAMSALLNDKIFVVHSTPTADTFTLTQLDIQGDVYKGGGTIARVSQIDVLTKQYNPYVAQGVNVTINKVDFLVERTDSGAIAVDYWASSNDLSMVETGESTGMALGTFILETTPYTLYPLEQGQSRLWHPLYFQTDGECIQFRLYYTDAQMRDPAISLEDFQLHAFALYALPTSRLQ